MPLKRSKKTSKIGTKVLPKLPKKQPVEDAFAKIVRERREKESREAAERKAIAISEKKEYERKNKHILDYLEKLMIQLNNKKYTRFYMFTDTKSTKKMTEDLDTLIKKFKKSPEKYGNRTIAEFKMVSVNKSRKDSVLRDHGIYISAGIRIFPIDTNGNIHQERTWQCDFIWLMDDFMLTKFSLKLIEQMAFIITKSRLSKPGLIGIPISVLLQDLKNRGYEFKEYLKPLAGL